jgi:superfamily II DNA or RNA helicase
MLTQMIGRGLRAAPGKRDCVVLDFAPGSIGQQKCEAVLRPAVRPKIQCERAA